MLRFLFSVLVMILLAACQPKMKLSGSNTLSSWEHEFYDNCGLPGGSFERIDDPQGKILRFQLEDGQVGSCRSDKAFNKIGKSRSGAPFWERSEYASRKRTGIGVSKPELVSAEVKFVEGFSGPRETFFQIHSGSHGCNSKPVLMMKWDNHYLTLQTRSKERMRSQSFSFFEVISNHLDRWIPIEIAIEDTTFKYVKFDGEVLLENYDFYYSKPCGATYIKFGIYRPGSWDRINRPNKRSVLEVRNVRTEAIE